MGKKALIEGTNVVQVSEETFEVHPSLVWVDCSDDVEYGWEYDGQSFIDPASLANVLSDDEKLDELRLHRNSLLLETDYFALSDNTLSAEMTTYRQALRDITDTYASLDDVVWPTKP